MKDFDISFAKGLSLEDGCATVTKFSAYLIAEGLKKLDERKNNSKLNYILCGGGRKNNFLIENIKNFILDKKWNLRKLMIINLMVIILSLKLLLIWQSDLILKLPISFPDTTRCKFPISGGVINKNF